MTILEPMTVDVAQPTNIISRWEVKRRGGGRGRIDENSWRYIATIDVCCIWNRWIIYLSG